MRYPPPEFPLTLPLSPGSGSGSCCRADWRPAPAAAPGTGPRPSPPPQTDSVGGQRASRGPRGSEGSCRSEGPRERSRLWRKGSVDLCFYLGFPPGAGKAEGPSAGSRRGELAVDDDPGLLLLLRVQVQVQVQVPGVLGGALVRGVDDVQAEAGCGGRDYFLCEEL
ncbi:hypothetical protein F7725_025934 [Dissostichus mawsoni]|uniref:Uncharacterized protein n=1 Tax=Dissostichus mawsoni TaxID=36200 RepID=A0A7J5X6J8_DISMA|nr:hypothetical protein F7725_025934 [Dissostichus mawsoni]